MARSEKFLQVMYLATSVQLVEWQSPKQEVRGKRFDTSFFQIFFMIFHFYEEINKKVNNKKSKNPRNSMVFVLWSLALGRWPLAAWTHGWKVAPAISMIEQWYNNITEKFTSSRIFTMSCLSKLAFPFALSGLCSNLLAIWPSIVIGFSFTSDLIDIFA